MSRRPFHYPAGGRTSPSEHWSRPSPSAPLPSLLPELSTLLGNIRTHLNITPPDNSSPKSRADKKKSRLRTPVPSPPHDLPTTLRLLAALLQHISTSLTSLHHRLDRLTTALHAAYRLVDRASFVLLIPRLRTSVLELLRIHDATTGPLLSLLAAYPALHAAMQGKAAVRRQSAAIRDTMERIAGRFRVVVEGVRAAVGVLKRVCWEEVIQDEGRELERGLRGLWRAVEAGAEWKVRFWGRVLGRWVPKRDEFKWVRLLWPVLVMAKVWGMRGVLEGCEGLWGRWFRGWGKVGMEKLEVAMEGMREEPDWVEVGMEGETVVLDESESD